MTFELFISKFMGKRDMKESRKSVLKYPRGPYLYSRKPCPAHTGKGYLEINTRALAWGGLRHGAHLSFFLCLHLFTKSRRLMGIVFSLECA